MGTISQTVLDTEIYKAVVDEIENQNNLVISDSEEAKTASSAITTNLTVPHFVSADEDIVKMLKTLKIQVADIIQTMRNIQLNIEDTNEDATVSGANLE